MLLKVIFSVVLLFRLKFKNKYIYLKTSAERNEKKSSLNINKSVSLKRLFVDCGGAHNLPRDSSAYTIVVIEKRNYLEDPTVLLKNNKEHLKLNIMYCLCIVVYLSICFMLREIM